MIKNKLLSGLKFVLPGASENPVKDVSEHPLLLLLWWFLAWGWLSILAMVTGLFF